MKLLSTKAHGVMDYVFGALLIATPWIMKFENDPQPTNLLIGLGVATIVYSLLTRYELGLIRVINYKAHLWLDAISGIFLLVSPWFFRFNEIVSMPFLIFGAVELLVVAWSVTKFSNYRRTSVHYK